MDIYVCFEGIISYELINSSAQIELTGIYEGNLIASSKAAI